MRTFVIGDIHGGLLALEQVMKRAQVTTQDTLIFLGDYVDGWSQSPQVIEYLMDLKSKQNCVCIRGNHDELLLSWFKNKTEDVDETLWFKHGGEATVLAYEKLSPEKKQLHIAFLESLEDYYLDDQNRLFVHAGFTNLNGVKHEFFPKLFYWDRTLWEMALSLDPNLKSDHALYPKRFTLYKEIYIGHTPVTRIGETIPVQKANVWNVDTGAAFKGPLTILNVDTKEFWQSEPLNELYSSEKGRN
ncbi:metallophosphoesterase family protein [Flavobacterium collinsii]|jgi:serine/threonine protein phosphatase 1|uniref:Serine/threonine-protein phosphatase 1 n=1 Tax=Flavobacterium collinsii TaxID=1114861 RepID=A0ABM8KDV6_9FLAO|nr:metallophosphoesterase family protein [Flavobacterium collinsii]GIQ58764.1 metallophosphatase [Flavobacterium collinsii]CAA9195099.1 Serine/threonine-protein phosphatase 1 [Flavobacterium collinsii]